ncbi:hypothetical protein RUND412_006287 [Rhizina undulata]
MGPPPAKRTIYYGTFVHSVSLKKLEIIENGAVGVREDGKIEWIERDVESVEDIRKRRGYGWGVNDAGVVESGEAGFFFPGLIDTHIHASQYPNAGLFGNSTLLNWLQEYTFPVEMRMADPVEAKRAYTRCVNRTLSHGTTTAAYYATIHVESTNILANVCLELGQRAFVGRCNMDTDLQPIKLRDKSPDHAMADTEATIAYCRKVDPFGELIAPIVTPRFAPSCSRDLLTRLGKLSNDQGLRCQTHISESKGEVQLVKDMFPEASSYAGVYDYYGLLNNRMILAHAVHLTGEEMDLISMRNAKVSHCPVSNSSLGSGEARVRKMIEKGIEVGLGTDMAGGFAPSVLVNARHAALVSRNVALVDEEEDSAKLSIDEVLYLATRGGAKVVGLENVIGGFEVGFEWDALLVGLRLVDDGGDCEFEKVVGDGPVDIFGFEDWEERVAKWVYNGDDRNNRGVWVKGREVYRRDIKKE